MGYWGNPEEISRYWENYLQGKNKICDGAFCRLNHTSIALPELGIIGMLYNQYRYNWHLHGYRGDKNIR